jgi:hypothetical protein
MEPHGLAAHSKTSPHNMFAARNMTFTRPVAGGGGSFDPLSLSPALWLSDTGSDPSVWSDESGNSRHAVQATIANQPSIVTGALNGRQVRRFDGVNDRLVTPSFAHYSVFAVMKWTGGSTFTTYAGIYTAGSNATLLGGIYTSNLYSEAGPTPYVNGVQTYACGDLSLPKLVSTSLTGLTGVGVIGLDRDYDELNRFWVGDIAEVYVLPYAATTAQRQDVETWLNTKYAIY